MCFGPEEHEAIEIAKAVMMYDMNQEVPIMIINNDPTSNAFSFVVVVV
jgi:hypothetical protein